MEISERATHGMRTGFVALVLALSMLIVTCDPGVTIRQADSRKEIGTPSGVIVRVKSTHQLIGTTFYAPLVTVTNNSEATVLVTGIELATKQRIYTDSSRRPQDFPGEISVKQAHDFTPWFRLDDAVYEALKEPAELRVHYRNGNNEGTARIAIVLSSLRDSR
jgi:hypothetical protein